MPCMLITPEAILHVEGRHTDILKEAGFQIAFPKNSEFTRGLCDEEESVDETADVRVARLVLVEGAVGADAVAEGDVEVYMLYRHSV